MRATAGAVSLFLGLGFGIPCVFGMRHLSRTGEVWTFLGLPTYGGGPFESMGVRTTLPLLGMFMAVCAVEVVLAGLLWTGVPGAPLVAYLLLPIELTFWLGFALPLGIPLGLARTILIVIANH